jgi:hypothetical protein
LGPAAQKVLKSSTRADHYFQSVRLPEYLKREQVREQKGTYRPTYAEAAFSVAALCMESHTNIAAMKSWAWRLSAVTALAYPIPVSSG